MNAEEITAGGGAESSFFVVSGTPGGKNWQVISMYVVPPRYTRRSGLVEVVEVVFQTQKHTYVVGGICSCIRVAVIDGCILLQQISGCHSIAASVCLLLK